jgi:hypothetical protein
MKIADLFVDLKLDTSGFDTSVKRAIQDGSTTRRSSRPRTCC